MKTPYEAYHVECAAGWKALYQPLIDLCALYGVQVMQVKEKFGGLRFYVAGERAAELERLIIAAETESYHVCEECGTNGISGHRHDADDTFTPVYKVITGRSETSSWIRSLCAECREKWDASRRQEKSLTT